MAADGAATAVGVMIVEAMSTSMAANMMAVWAGGLGRDDDSRIFKKEISREVSVGAPVSDFLIRGSTTSICTQEAAVLEYKRK